MRAEIISIGDELTTGQRLDTNCQWLAERLLEVGVPVAFHTTVGDTLADNVLVFRQAAERAEIVVATGGLGPTADDLTRQALADVAGVPLVQDDASLAHIKALFARRKREMPPANVVQAQFPQGSRPIANPHGTAPGIHIEVPRSEGKPARIFAMPGVPAEMREMWTASVAPAIQQLLGAKKTIAHYRIKCFGVGESDLEAMLPDLIARQRYPLVGITVHEATITLRISAEGETTESARAAMRPTIDTIHQCLGDLIFGYEDDELQDVVLRLLRERQKKVFVVESVSGTAGLISHWLADANPQDTLLSALISAADLSFPPDAPSPSKSERSNDDYTLCVSGFLPTVERKQIGNMTIVISHKDAYVRKEYGITGHPQIMKPRAAKFALNLLRLHLLGKA